MSRRERARADDREAPARSARRPKRPGQLRSRSMRLFVQARSFRCQLRLVPDRGSVFARHARRCRQELVQRRWFQSAMGAGDEARMGFVSDGSANRFSRRRQPASPQPETVRCHGLLRHEASPWERGHRSGSRFTDVRGSTTARILSITYDKRPSWGLAPTSKGTARGDRFEQDRPLRTWCVPASRRQVPRWEMHHMMFFLIHTMSTTYFLQTFQLVCIFVLESNCYFFLRWNEIDDERGGRAGVERLEGQRKRLFEGSAQGGNLAFSRECRDSARQRRNRPVPTPVAFLA